MNCTHCAQPVLPDARFCTHCGTPIVFLPSAYNRVATHLQPLGILWLLYAGLRAMKGVVGLTFIHHFFGDHGYTFFPIWPFAGMALAVGVIGAILTGFALLMRQPWGRVVGIVFGILALLHPVIGTALGIYTLWVLAPRASAIAYNRVARPTYPLY